jgi:hypothetical protein
MSVDKNKMINNYFKIFEVEYPSLQRSAKFGTGFLALGFLLFYMQYISVFTNVDLVATVFIIVGVFSFWLWLRPFFFLKKIFYSRPSDGDIDFWFLEDIHETVKQRALDQLKINASKLRDENIIIVPYPVYWQYPGIEPEKIIRRLGDEEGFAYSVWVVQILVVTEKFISFYSCAYHWLENRIFDERTNEYFFDDISSVRNDYIEVDKKFIDNPEQSIGMSKVFMLTNMSGDSHTVITEIPSLKIPPACANDLEKLVQGLRVMLRNRRFGEEIELPPIVDETQVVVDLDEIESKEEVFFHQQLREIYDEYSKDLDEKRKAKYFEKQGISKPEFT